MDLAHDILRLADKVAQVPGLSIACSLAMQIIKTVQISKNNTARLQYLAHSVATHLVTIAGHMHGRWDNVSDTMKGRLDEFEDVLHSIIKVVTKYSKTSRLVALVNASDRELEITQIEKRLADVQRSVLILLGVDASVTLHTLGMGVNRLLTAVDSHPPLWQEAVQQVQRTALNTHSRVSRIESALERVAFRPDSQALDRIDLRTYTRHDVRLVRKITSGPLSFRTRNAVIVTLHEAQRCTDGQTVLVRTYEGSDPSKRAREFSRDLSAYANIWDPTVLQLVGASASTFPIPFQVCHAPDGQVENVEDWLHRTMISNPVETICGLYQMRTSIKALLDFQNSRGVNCRVFFWNSLVNVRISGSQVEWALLYTGEMEHSDDEGSLTIPFQYQYVSPSRNAPNWGVVDAFSKSSEMWGEGAPVLDALFNGGIPKLDMTTLGSVLFENGWLGATNDYHPSNTTVGLGDVGYTTKDNRFVVVSNVHSFLTSANEDPLTWNCRLYDDPDDSPAVECRGKTYRRFECRQESSYFYSLNYANLNERHAWKVLQEHACEIVTRQLLGVNPHDIKLIIHVKHSGEFDAQSLQDSEDTSNAWDAESALASDTFRDQASLVQTVSAHSTSIRQLLSQGSNKAVAQSGMRLESDLDTSNQHTTSMSFTEPACSRDTHEHLLPPYYVFAGDVPIIRDSGIPELPPCLRASLQADPEWLGSDNPFWVDNGTEHMETRIVETVDGYELLEETGCTISYLQLPPGVALPYVEVVES